MSKSIHNLRVLFLLATAILLLACIFPAFRTGMVQAVYQELSANTTHIVSTDNQTTTSSECPECSTGGMGAGTSTRQETGPEIAAVTSGLYQRFIFNLPGGYAAAGVGMRNRGYGNINISSIPCNSTIERAYLYWDVLDNSEKPEFKMGKFNGTSVEGTLIGSGPDPCWDPTMNFAYRSEVTDLVMGDGIYALTDFASGRQDGCDPWSCSQDFPLLEGASLVIIYRNTDSPVQTIVVYDGAQTLAGTSYTVSIAGFTAPSPVGSASITYLGADGQGNWFDDAAECTYFNGIQIADRDWEGSDPQAGPSYSYGNLWDTNTYDVTSLVNPGDTSATATVRSYPGNQGYWDCLVWVAAVFAVSAEPPVYEPWSFAVMTDLHIGWGIPDYGSEGYYDTSGGGQEYYLTQRLRRTVQWINDHYIDNNIKFVVVTGDVADTAEYSELVKARDILNELEIPYIPIIGNHDIWPYTMKINANPDDRNPRNVKYGMIDGPPLGDQYFEEAFWNTNTINKAKIDNLFGQCFQMQGSPYLQNYVLYYNGENFIALDFASRNRSGNKNQLQVGRQEAVLYEPTMDWFGEKLSNNEGERVTVLAHHPFKVGPFSIEGRITVSDYIRNCTCDVYDFGGHTHVNEVGSPGGEYVVIETEAISQIGFLGQALTGEVIRLVKIEGGDISYETLVNGFPPAINPWFKVSHEELAVGRKITFIAYPNNGEISSFSWDFGDGEHATTSNPKYVKIYTQPGYYKVTLTATDAGGNSESISWNLNIKTKAKGLHKVVLPVSGLVPVLNGEDMDLTQEEYAQNTASWAVIAKTATAGEPIAALLIHFEQATEDVDLSKLIANTDLTKRKSVIHMDSWPEIIEESKELYIPSTGVGSVYICPNATSLEEVAPLCKNVTVLDIGETEDGITLTKDNYYVPEYYLVSDIKSGGGGEFGPLEKSIKNLNDYIKDLPIGAFKNNPEQRKNALENKLYEVWTEIDDREYQKAINTLKNHIRAQADGDKKAEDWIITPVAQKEICRMVDELITHLNRL